MNRNFYQILGVSPAADRATIRSAYKEAVIRFHPDKNTNPQAASEFMSIQAAYETLDNEDLRYKYDIQENIHDYQSPISVEMQLSQQEVECLPEPQLVYSLLNIECSVKPELTTNAPLAVILVVDCSTSMQGERLDCVKRNILNFIQNLKYEDIFSVITFSDRAKIIIPLMKAGDYNIEDDRVARISAMGGTELFQGLYNAIAQLNISQTGKYRRHILLFTDGNTYGDERECLQIAKEAVTKNVIISAFGLGDQWNDVLLDEITSQTGGNTNFISNSTDLDKYMQEKLQAMGQYFTQSVKFQYSSDSGVALQYAFRICPDSSPLQIDNNLLLGNVPFTQNLTILLEFLVPLCEKNVKSIKLAQGFITLESPFWVSDIRLFLNIQTKVGTSNLPEKPPASIFEAVSNLVLYRMQESAKMDIAQGDVAKAIRRLNYLAAHLKSVGNYTLAKIVEREIATIQQSKQFSPNGGKTIKYGTRALLLPSG